MILDVLKFDSKSIAFIDSNNIAIINDYFDKKEFVIKNLSELFNLNIGIKKIIKNLLLIPFPYFTGFYNNHITSSFFKSTYEFAWKNYYEVLDKTCKCKIRERTNVNQWLIKDLQFVKGLVKNRKSSFGKRINIRNYNIDICINAIKEQKVKILCINDNELLTNSEFEEINNNIHKAFKNILNFQSLYEKKSLEKIL